MGFFQRIFGSRDEERFDIGSPSFRPSDYLPPTFGNFSIGGRSDSGIVVDEYTAMTVSAVQASVNIISSTIATLPVTVHHRVDQTSQPTHPLTLLLGETPNEFMSSSTFWQTMMVNLLLWGHCNAFILKDDIGEPTAMYPLRSAVTRPTRISGELLYLTQVGTTMQYLTPDQIFHVNYMTIDGITPISPIQEAKQSIGLSLALEKYAAKFFSGGGNSGGLLTLPVGMKEEGIRNFVASWKRNYGGVDNAFKVATLPADYKYTATTVNPEAAQAVEARSAQVKEVARVYRVPLHKLAEMDRATFNNVEQASIEFQQECIRPWVVKLEQECNRKLLLEREKPTLTLKWDLDGLLRSDKSARYAAYNTGRQCGFLSINDIRRSELLPPIEGGDTYLNPLNMAAVDAAPPAAPLEAKPDAGASRSLLEDAAKRVLTKESKALTRAAKKYQGKPEEMRAWFESWYLQHEPLVALTLAPSLKAAKVSTTPEAYAKQHVTESKRAIAAALDSSGGVDDVIDEWDSIRPTEIANQLLVL